jgi:hypothetical protein
MYLNVFIMYLNIFQCTYNIFMVYLNVCIVYLNVFECTYNIFVVYFNVPIIYFNAFIVCFNVFQCLWMYFNVFECFFDIVIEFHHHFLIVTFLPSTPAYTFFFFTLYNDSLPNMLYHYVHFFPFPLIHSNFHTIYTYFSRLYITSHSTFYVITGCAEHSGAQVCLYLF